MAEDWSSSFLHVCTSTQGLFSCQIKVGQYSDILTEQRIYHIKRHKKTTFFLWKTVDTTEWTRKPEFAPRIPTQSKHRIGPFCPVVDVAIILNTIKLHNVRYGDMLRLFFFSFLVM